MECETVHYTAVPGYLHGPLQRKHSFLGSTVEVVLVATGFGQREARFEQIGARIAPWKSLQNISGILLDNIVLYP